METWRSVYCDPSRRSAIPSSSPAVVVVVASPAPAGAVEVVVDVEPGAVVGGGTVAAGSGTVAVVAGS